MASNNVNENAKVFFLKVAELYANYSFDFSKAKYVNSYTKLNICAEHGEFFKTPDQLVHFNSFCGECKKEIKRKERESNFLAKSHLLHGSKYDYSNVYYRTENEKIEIICPTHGSFNQKPGVHLNGSGCPECGKLVTRSERKVVGGKLLCGGCQKWKFPSEFHQALGKKSGRVSHCKECKQQIFQTKYWQDGTYRQQMLKNKFGITQEHYDAMLKSQEYKCAICQKVSPGRVDVQNFAVDHDQETGKVRALLCSYCNLGIGSFGDSVKVLELAKVYLERWKK